MLKAYVIYAPAQEPQTQDGPEAGRSFNEAWVDQDRAEDLMRRMEAFRKRDSKHDFDCRRRM